MRISRTRRALAPSRTKSPLRRGLVSTCLTIGALTAALLPSPAHATTIVCDTLMESTPTVRVDVDGDGYPEHEVPTIQNITLCSEASASYVTSPPRTENCFAGWHPTCIAVYVDLMPVDAQAGASAKLCAHPMRARVPICLDVRTPPSVFEPVSQTVCIGFDLSGGHPCSGEALALTLQ